MDANRTFINGPEQPTRQDPATGDFSSLDVAIFHAALRDKLDWEPFNTLPSGHSPIIVTIHLPTEKLRGKNRLVWDWKKGHLAIFTIAVDEQLRGSGPTVEESLTQMYRSFLQSGARFCRKTHWTEDRGDTGEYWKTLVIAKEERVRDMLKERQGIHSE